MKPETVKELALGLYDCCSCSATLISEDNRFLVISGTRMADLFPKNDYWDILIDGCYHFDKGLVREIIARIAKSGPYEFKLDRVLFIADGEISNIEEGSLYD